MMRTLILAGLLGSMLGPSTVLAAGPSSGAGSGSEEREVPAAFAPFEHMIGSWKGQGIPTANRLKGWPEKHMWAWKFAGGAPVGMSITLEGNKTLTRADLTYDAAGKRYRLEGTDPQGHAVAYTGTFGGTTSSKLLTLDRVGETPEGKERLVIWPYSNMIRYSLWFDREEPGAPQYKRLIEVGLTKEGEAFAAGGAAADLPRCVITGGAASLTVAYQGKSYPICCSGCRDEFNDNPEKYVKKAALRAEKGGSPTPVKAATSRVGKDDGAFAGFGDDEKEKPAARPGTATPPKHEAPKAAKPTDASKDETGDDANAKDEDKNESRAESILRLGQNLEKAGKGAAALPFFRRVVKEYPGTNAASTAAARIKALGGK